MRPPTELGWFVEQNVLIFGLFGPCPPSHIAQASNCGLSVVPKGAGVPLGISWVENESFACN